MSKPSANKVTRLTPRQPPPSSGERAEIIVEGGELSTNTDRADEVLSECINVYQQNDRLVRVVNSKESPNKFVSESESSIITADVDTTHAIELLTRSADWLKYDVRSSTFKRINCPRSIAESLLARKQYRARRLNRVVTSPTLRQDGTLLDSVGYDEQSGYLVPGPIPVGYTTPLTTKSYARASVKTLQELLKEFPTVGDCDMSAGIAAIITGLVVPSVSPLFPVMSSTPGTGKSTMTDMVHRIATGKPAPVVNLSVDKSEVEKHIGALLLRSPQIIVFDNIEFSLEGAFLCQIITQEEIDIRILGKSTSHRVRTNCVFLANGNNLGIKKDMRRRVVPIRLDAKSETPEHRVFKRDIVDYINRNRGQLITAALSLPLAYAAAGYPDVNIKPFNSFQDWDRLCRRPLVWLGMPDPLDTRKGLSETDSDLIKQRELYAAWWACCGDSSVTAKELIDLQHHNKLLVEALNAVCADHISSSRLSGWLRRHQDKIVDGLRLNNGGPDTHSKIVKWNMERVG